MELITHTGRYPIILVVDDSQMNREVVTAQIDVEMKCDIRQASCGTEALQILEGTAPDLVLLDVNMPGMDGYAVCRAIRAGDATREIPVIFLTGQRDTEFIVNGFEAGGSDYLLKPYEGRELLARVRVHLELKLRRDELKTQRDELSRRNSELEAAIARVKRLEGIIPICMYCKKIRSDATTWQKIERYIEEHSDAFFSHGICPDCFEKTMTDLKASKALEP
ncbi:MAG: response regulator [Desulfuromonadaceae bacterium]|nr:response regulator [Desulfuromonadaceae bacterium]